MSKVLFSLFNPPMNSTIKIDNFHTAVYLGSCKDERSNGTYRSCLVLMAYGSQFAYYLTQSSYWEAIDETVPA